MKLCDYQTIHTILLTEIKEQIQRVLFKATLANCDISHTYGLLPDGDLAVVGCLTCRRAVIKFFTLKHHSWSLDYTIVQFYTQQQLVQHVKEIAFSEIV